MASYEDAVILNGFKGVLQQYGDADLNQAYAYRAENMDTTRGRLARAKGYAKAFPPLNAKIGTLARFYRRSIEEEENRECFAAVTLDGIYTYVDGDEAWIKRYPQTGALEDDVFDAITYETAVEGETVDLLILTNPKDGMIAIYGNDLHAEKKTIQITADGPEIKFGVLGRHAERIWAAGVEGEPDNLYYSRPYAPFDWSADEETPELGGGMIQQPTWDGDAFIALRTLGGYLIAVRRRSIFAIRGTDPSSYVVDEMYGSDGPQDEKSIAVDGSAMYYLAEGGLGVFDGTTAQLLAKDALYETMRMRPNDFEHTECACTAGHVYYLAMRVRENVTDAPKENNAVIEYDIRRGTLMLRTGIRVDSFLAAGGKVYFTSGDEPGRVYLYGESDTYDGGAIHTRWMTGYIDRNGKNVIKSAFVVRFFAKGEQGAVLNVSIETERKRKTKSVALTREGKQHRLRIQNRGRRWRMEIQSDGTQPWEIQGGIQINYETDEE